VAEKADRVVTARGRERAGRSQPPT